MPKVRAILEVAEAGRGAAYISPINLGEVLYIAERARGLLHAHRVLAAVDTLLSVSGRRSSLQPT